MDEESKQLLRRLVDLQTEQIELMRNNLLPLWTHVRFSVSALLILMTVAAVALGLIALATGSQNYSMSPPPSSISANPFGPRLMDRAEGITIEPPEKSNPTH